MENIRLSYSEMNKKGKDAMRRTYLTSYPIVNPTIGKKLYMI